MRLGQDTPIGIGRVRTLRGSLNPIRLTGLADCSTLRRPAFHPDAQSGLSLIFPNGKHGSRLPLYGDNTR